MRTKIFLLLIAVALAGAGCLGEDPETYEVPPTATTTQKLPDNEDFVPTTSPQKPVTPPKTNPNETNLSEVTVHMKTPVTYPEEKYQATMQSQNAILYVTWGSKGAPGELVIDSKTGEPRKLNGKYIVMDSTFIKSKLKEDVLPKCYATPPVIALEGNVQFVLKQGDPNSQLYSSYYEVKILSFKKLHINVVAPCVETE